MSVLKEIVVAVTGVYALLFVCDALFIPGRFDEVYFDRSFYAPRSTEVRIASYTPPAIRVRDAFAQFPPQTSKPARRYSSLTTIVR
ncbi:hypothetical protein JQ596_19355 [Bradyrhizobium manausense]|uniref:hypothetical protein n=1 Tax=Bradyrhizobium TaxID=374 RepID=UPI001BABCF7C|nr:MULTISPECIES: hypothetical protein [Bradyrhizobium]MBR0827689.1 hypothetical protein [Bradyrhizobium manausense]UVO26165.1 hypothetical protein KUF59_26815 [Bradyrhizobium arachidis]